MTTDELIARTVTDLTADLKLPDEQRQTIEAALRRVRMSVAIDIVSTSPIKRFDIKDNTVVEAIRGEYVLYADVSKLLHGCVHMMNGTEASVALRVLQSIVNVGHNDDCMFCGFKDSRATSEIDRLTGKFATLLNGQKTT